MNVIIKRKQRNSGMLIALVFSLFMSISAIASSEVELPLRFDRYYDYADVNDAIKKLAKAYPDLCQYKEIGKSDEGRAILALIINNKNTGSQDDKPGVYVDGNIHGNEIQAGEVCLYLAQYLLKHHGINKEITKTLDRNAWFIVPVVNVDGRYHFFNDANTAHSNRSVRRPKDDDYDGLFDEDPMDDLDGDGNICQMRKKDPQGQFKPDPKDARLLVRVKQGEKGSYTMLGYEGIDNDGDGRINEDGEGYVDPNRNWPGSWEPDYIQRGAGDFPLSSKSTRTVAAFIERHPNIIISWNFHNAGGMFLSGPGRKGEFINSSDMKVYQYLGKEAEKMVPGARYMTALQLYPTYGGTIDFAFYTQGAFGFVGELFMSSQETFKPYKSEGLLSAGQQRLKFNDEVVHGDLYKEWKAFKHPLYGDIEIGGWKKMSSRLPHPFMLTDLVHRNAAAVLFSASQTPQIALKVSKQEKLTKGLYRINVELENTGNIPSMSYTSISNKIHPMDQLIIEDAKVVTGGKLLNVYTNQVSLKKHHPELQFLRVEGNAKVTYQFIIEGKGRIRVRYVSQKAGNKEISYRM